MSFPVAHHPPLAALTTRVMLPSEALKFRPSTVSMDA
jgi:hypothetical protein